MRNRKDVHVMPHPKGWAARTEGSSRAAKVAQTQDEAIEVARQIARNNRSEVVVHGRDGEIRSKDSHGRDPHPPRG